MDDQRTSSISPNNTSSSYQSHDPNRKNYRRSYQNKYVIPKLTPTDSTSLIVNPNFHESFRQTIEHQEPIMENPNENLVHETQTLENKNEQNFGATTPRLMNNFVIEPKSPYSTLIQNELENQNMVQGNGEEENEILRSHSDSSKEMEMIFSPNRNFSIQNSIYQFSDSNSFSVEQNILNPHVQNILMEQENINNDEINSEILNYELEVRSDVSELLSASASVTSAYIAEELAHQEQNNGASRRSGEIISDESQNLNNITISSNSMNMIDDDENNSISTTDEPSPSSRIDYMTFSGNSRKGMEMVVPIVNYTANKMIEEDICVICLENFDECPKFRVDLLDRNLDNNIHIVHNSLWHKECIYQWIDQIGIWVSCPLCQEELDDPRNYPEPEILSPVKIIRQTFLQRLMQKKHVLVSIILATILILLLLILKILSDSMTD